MIFILEKEKQRTSTHGNCLLSLWYSLLAKSMYLSTIFLKYQGYGVDISLVEQALSRCRQSLRGCQSISPCKSISECLHLLTCCIMR